MNLKERVDKIEEEKQPATKPQIYFLRTGETLKSTKNRVATVDPSQKDWIIVRWLE